jgi:hypothetical protein
LNSLDVISNLHWHPDSPPSSAAPANLQYLDHRSAIIADSHFGEAFSIRATASIEFSMEFAQVNRT